MLPVRTIHHLSCSGGTLISKCVAVSGNPLFLSEINPNARQSRVSFAPMDLLSQLDIQYHVLTASEKEAHFRAQMGILNDVSDREGRPICIRDHTHSSFLRQKPAETSEMREMLERAGYATLSIATVRHPLDAFAAMRKSKWTSGVNDALDEYCTRVLSFKRYCDANRIPIWKYENFCLDPTEVMKELCEALDLTFNPHFLADFGDIRLTGDSGRSSRQIDLRPRRPMSDALLDEAKRSEAFIAACEAFGYATDPDAHPLDTAGNASWRQKSAAHVPGADEGQMNQPQTTAKKTGKIGAQISAELEWVFETIVRGQSGPGTGPSVPDDLIDVAHGKPFRLGSAHPRYALEGRVRSKAPFFFHTAVEEAGPMITVDLQGEATLHEVIIANRTDQLPGRAANLVVIAHETSDPKTGTGFPVNPDKAFLQINGAETSLALPGVTARYVTVVSPVQTALHFSDLRIMGRAGR